ncbi:hypothetical protein B0T17DRAFT_188464 [Bombardia bombarda]|uniref:Uncharacterized protein n=1 Tax=Bombardia bombarda TaxID=252184 RepID=A0AA40C9T1_9PEZI|nr:hypothetical protein B0T17DRAFT_188464 [Bombardia bombarda]
MPPTNPGWVKWGCCPKRGLLGQSATQALRGCTMSSEAAQIFASMTDADANGSGIQRTRRKTHQEASSHPWSPIRLRAVLASRGRSQWAPLARKFERPRPSDSKRDPCNFNYLSRFSCLSPPCQWVHGGFIAVHRGASPALAIKSIFTRQLPTPRTTR